MAALAILLSRWWNSSTSRWVSRSRTCNSADRCPRIAASSRLRVRSALGAVQVRSVASSIRTMEASRRLTRSSRAIGWSSRGGSSRSATRESAASSSAGSASSPPARCTRPSGSRTRARLSPISSIDVGAIEPLSRAAPLSPSEASGTAARVAPLSSAIRRSVKWTSSASPQPGQTRTVSSNFEMIGEVLALQRLLHVGGEESERERAGREPPCGQAEEDGEHTEERAQRLESDSGRRAHVDDPETAAGVVFPKFMRIWSGRCAVSPTKPLQHSSCPDLFRASLSVGPVIERRATWMAGSSPAMTGRGRRVDGQKLPERDTSAPPWPPLPLPPWPSL